MDLFPHLETGLAIFGLSIGGVMCTSCAVASHQAWLSALERLASRRSSRLPRGIATLSLFAGTAATCNAAQLWGAALPATPARSAISMLAAAIAGAALFGLLAGTSG